LRAERRRGDQLTGTDDRCRHDEAGAEEADRPGPRRGRLADALGVEVVRVRGDHGALGLVSGALAGGHATPSPVGTTTGHCRYAPEADRTRHTWSGGGAHAAESPPGGA